MKKLSRIIMSFMVFLSPLIIALPTARAATDTCTWTGAVNGNWSNGGNWTGCDNGGVPENGDTLLFPNSASNKTSTNDIVGLSVASVIFTGQNYIINGSSLVITGLTAVQFTNTSGNNDLGIVSNVTSSSGVISQDNGASSNTISGNIVFTVTNDMNFYNYDSDNLILTGDRSGSSSNVNYYGNISLSGTGTNTYTGAINVSNTIGASKLFVNSTTTLGAGNPSVNVTGEAGVSFEAAGTYTNNVSISASGTEATNIQSNGNVTLSGTINAFAPSGYIKPQSGNLELSGQMNIQDNLEWELSPSTSVNKTGANTIDISAGKTLTIQGLGATYSSQTATINSNITGASSTAIVLSGSATVTLDNFSTLYNGTITANSGVMLTPKNAESLGSTTGSTTLNSGSVMRVVDSVTFTENINLSGTGLAGTAYGYGVIHVQQASPEFSGTTTLANDSAFAIEDNDDSGDVITFSGVINGTGNLTLLRAQGINATRFNFLQTSPNTYSGKTIVQGASLELNGGAQTIPNDLDINSTPTQSAVVSLASDDDIADDSVLTLNDEATPGTFASLFMPSTFFDDTIGTLNGNGTVCFDNSSQILSVGGGNLSGSFSGFLCSTGTDVGKINKLGSGNWELANGAAYESATNGPQLLIEGGSIAVNANLPATTIDVDGGGTLKGTGTTGNVTLNSAGNINAGNSPGCITVGDLNMTNGSIFTQEIAGNDACSGYDRVSTSSSVQLGNATLNVVPSYQPTVGTVFTIVQADSINGIFNGLPDGAKFTSNGLEFQIDYSETQVTLTFLSGTLASTGQNSNQIAIVALSILILSLAGLGIERLTRKPIKINA